MKKIVLIDMDGVLVELGDEVFKDFKNKKGYFINKKPIKGAVEAFKKLSQYYDCYIVTTPVWSNPDCWKEKRLWVEKYLGKCATKKLTLTHNKNLIKGDYIIDDTTNHGVDKFDGEHILYGGSKYKTWDIVLNYLLA